MVNLKVLDEILNQKQQNNYPFFNLIKESENHFILELAVAGFKSDELMVETEGTSLVVSGELKGDVKPMEYLHKGISGRSFSKRFIIDENIILKNLKLENGIFSIYLKYIIPDKQNRKTFKLD